MSFLSKSVGHQHPIQYFSGVFVVVEWKTVPLLYLALVFSLLCFTGALGELQEGNVKKRDRIIQFSTLLTVNPGDSHLTSLYASFIIFYQE
jgi:hypothetical protein